MIAYNINTSEMLDISGVMRYREKAELRALSVVPIVSLRTCCHRPGRGVFWDTSLSNSDMLEAISSANLNEMTCNTVTEKFIGIVTLL